MSKKNDDGTSYWVMPRCPVSGFSFKEELGASRDLALSPTSDFNIKTPCIYEIINKLFYQKMTLFIILLPYKLCVN
jgi:hypothetical protein